jgi:DNA-damage-inducible protein J
MARTKAITVRMDPDLKDSVEHILDKLGLSTSQAIMLFYKQIELHQGLPFDVRLPNAETRKTIADARAGKDVATFATPEELFKDLGI